MNWPNLVPVPELYRWLRDEVPGGRLIAPLLAYAGIGTLLLFAGRYWWAAFFSPLFDVIQGEPIAQPSVAHPRFPCKFRNEVLDAAQPGP